MSRHSLIRWFAVGANLTNLTNPPQPRHLAPTSERTRSREAYARTYGHTGTGRRVAVSS